jgi:outer membrane protein assembly factor BamB
MVRPALAALTIVLACAPHERPREPNTPCPAGMQLIEPDPAGIGATQRFCMDLTEVTTAAYGACVRAGDCTPTVDLGPTCNLTDAARGDHPINCTTWVQAQSFCAWAGKRLPDDHEWIWAARGGSHQRPYPWGVAPLDATRACWNRGAAGTCAVGSAPAGASPAGLLDLIGNVAEWTRAPDGGEGSRGHLRGGSWQDDQYVQPIDSRHADSNRDPLTETAARTSGLRCVVAPDTPVPEIDDSTWVAHVPARDAELPILAAPPPRTAPTRPLANLAVLHRAPDPPDIEWPIGGRYIALDPATAAAIGLQDPLRRAEVPPALREFRALRSLGATVLMSWDAYNERKFVAVEPTTYKVRWQSDLKTRSYDQQVAPRTLVAQSYGADVDILTAFALDSGREVWRTPGGPDGPFTRIRRIWLEGERGYFTSDRGLTAFDPTTGAIAWTAPVRPGCGVATSPHHVVVEDPGPGHRALDPATGALVRRIHGSLNRCVWAESTHDGGTANAAIDGDQLVAFEPPAVDKQVARLHAFDLQTGAERWRGPVVAVDLLLIDHDAVYVQRAPEVLTALDAATGQPRAEISIGSEYSAAIEPGGGAAGPLLVVQATQTGTWIVGRGEQPPVLEAYTIRGRLAPTNIPKRSAGNVPVRVGERKVRTDASGRFEVRGKALGAVGIALGTDRGPHEHGSRVRFESTAVTLTGQRTYDVGDIELLAWELY